MNTPASPAAPRRRRVWPWVLLAVLLTPFLVAGAAAYSFLTLDREAAVLRKNVFAATGSGWKTKVQVSIGGFTLNSVRFGLGFVQNENIDRARLALAAVRSASVGVYTPKHGQATWSRERLMNETDEAMRERGWTRIVGVAEKRETVLIYMRVEDDEPDEICLAVAKQGELVIVSARLEAEGLSELIQSVAGEKLKFGRADRITRS